MKIVDVRELSVPLTGDIANALVNFSQHTVSVVAVVSDVIRNGKPITGIAFDSIGRYAQGGILRERFFPRLLSAAPEDLLSAEGDQFDPVKIRNVLLANEKPGGHGDRAAAVGALELAFWDLNAKLRDEPACQTIANYFNTTFKQDGGQSPQVAVYAAGGYYHPTKGIGGLEDELRAYQDQGYVDFKIKIGGASLQDDIERIEAAAQVAGGGQHISVDANGRFDLKTALAYADALLPFQLRWYEEAGDPLDYELNHELSAHYPLPLATGENLFSIRDVDNLIRYGGVRPGIDIFQMDPGLSYGLIEYAQMIEHLEAKGFSRSAMFPHGGHLINLHVVAGLGLGGCESYPDVFQPFGGYSEHCQQGEGFVSPTHAPGFGLEQKTNLNVIIEKLLG